jgi:hypothetical protein
LEQFPVGYRNRRGPFLVVVTGKSADKGLGSYGFEFLGASLTMLDVHIGPALGPASQLRPGGHNAATDRPQAGVSFSEIVEQGRSDEILPIGLSARDESCAAQAMPLIGHRLIEKGFELCRAKPITDLGFFCRRQGLGSQNVEKPSG